MSSKTGFLCWGPTRSTWYIINSSIPSDIYNKIEITCEDDVASHWPNKQTSEIVVTEDEVVINDWIINDILGSIIEEVHNQENAHRQIEI